MYRVSNTCTVCHRCSSKLQGTVLFQTSRTFRVVTRQQSQKRKEGTRTFCLVSKLRFDQSVLKQWLKKAVEFVQSENGQLALFGLVCYLVLSGKISWIFDSLLIFFSVLSILPIVGLVVFRWWVSKNVVQVYCPNCSAPVVGIKGREVPCSNCGYLLTVEDQVIVAKDSSSNENGSRKGKSSISVIDVDAKEIGDE